MSGSMVLGKIMGPRKLKPIIKESEGRNIIEVCQHDFVGKDLFKLN